MTRICNFARIRGTALLVLLLAPLLAAAQPGEQWLSRLSPEGRDWVEQSCSKTLGPSLYLACVERETHALLQGVPDFSELPDKYQIWIQQSCSTTLGPALYAACVEREKSALRSGEPQLDSLDPE